MQIFKFTKIHPLYTYDNLAYTTMIHYFYKRGYIIKTAKSKIMAEYCRKLDYDMKKKLYRDENSLKNIMVII